MNNRGMVPSTSKYVRFYREWMPKNHPALFGGGDKSSSGDARAGGGGAWRREVRDRARRAARGRADNR